MKEAEEIYLSALTGRIVGEHIMAGYNKIATVGTSRHESIALASSAISAFLSQTEGRAMHFMNGDAEKVKKYDGDAIFLAFEEEERDLLLKTLSSFASQNIVADIVIHRAGNMLENLDERTMDYLKNRNVYTYDFNAEYMVVYEIEFENGISFHQIAEIPITCEHFNLLKERGLINERF